MFSIDFRHPQQPGVHVYGSERNAAATVCRHGQSDVCWQTTVKCNVHRMASRGRLSHYPRCVAKVCVFFVLGGDDVSHRSAVLAIWVKACLLAVCQISLKCLPIWLPSNLLMAASPKLSTLRSVCSCGANTFQGPVVELRSNCEILRSGKRRFRQNSRLRDPSLAGSGYLPPCAGDIKREQLESLQHMPEVRDNPKFQAIMDDVKSSGPMAMLKYVCMGRVTQVQAPAFNYRAGHASFSVIHHWLRASPAVRCALLTAFDTSCCAHVNHPHPLPGSGGLIGSAGSRARGSHRHLTTVPETVRTVANFYCTCKGLPAANFLDCDRYLCSRLHEPMATITWERFIAATKSPPPYLSVTAASC